MARLIDADELLKDNTWEWFDEWGNYTLAGQAIADAPTVDAAPVVQGEWKVCEDDWNYETIYECLICGFGIKTEQGSKFDWNFCPNCGADMRVGRWKGEGMGDYSCSLCGEVVSGNHREECPNCHAKMDGGDK